MQFGFVVVGGSWVFFWLVGWFLVFVNWLLAGGIVLCLRIFGFLVGQTPCKTEAIKI